MDRDSTSSPELRVNSDELAVLADRLQDIVEDAIARARHEYIAAAGDPGVIHRRRGADGVGGAVVARPRLPEWLPDLDAAWQHQRAALIRAAGGAPVAVVGTAASFRAIDDHVRAGLSGLDRHQDGRDRRAAMVPDGAAVAPSASDRGASAGVGTLRPDGTRNSSPDDRTSLEFAIAVWTERGKSSSHTLQDITDRITGHAGWAGLAATAYTEWLQAHRGRWLRLHEDALRIRDALAAHDSPSTVSTGPVLIPAGTLPAEVLHRIGARSLLPGETMPAAALSGEAATGDRYADGRPRRAMASEAALPGPATVPAGTARVSSQPGPDPTPHPAAHRAGAVSPDATPPNRLPDTSARGTTTSREAEAGAGAGAGAGPTRSDTRRDNTDKDDPADPDDPQAPDMITTNPVVAAALLGGGIAVGATTMAVIAAARPARALQVVPPIAYTTPDGPPVHHRVNPVNGPGGAGAPARSWSAAAPPPSTTPSSIRPPGGGSGTAASTAPRIGDAPPGHRVCLGPDSVSAALDAFTTFPGRDRPSPADAAAEHNQPGDHSSPHDHSGPRDRAYRSAPSARPVDPEPAQPAEHTHAQPTATTALPPPAAPADPAPPTPQATRTEPTTPVQVAPGTAAALTVATLTVFGETCLRYRGPNDTQRAAPPDTHPDTAAGDNTARDNAAGDNTAADEQSSGGPDGRIIEGLGPRATELLLFLAVHPGGAGRDYLVATLWPDTAGDRPSGPFYNLLARIRRTLHTATDSHDLDELIIRTGDKYRLNLDLVAIDYATFLHAATDINHPDPTTRTRACETVIHTYRGALGREHTSSEWLLELQLNARYRYLCALTSLAQLTLDTDPDRTLGLLETARLHEPTNEDIYRSIMTIHDHQHRPDAALNTYALLQAHLDNLDNTLTPEPATTALALRIRDTHTQQLRRTPSARSA